MALDDKKDGDIQNWLWMAAKDHQIQYSLWMKEKGTTSNIDFGWKQKIATYPRLPLDGRMKQLIQD